MRTVKQMSSTVDSKGTTHVFKVIHMLEFFAGSGPYAPNCALRDGFSEELRAHFQALSGVRFSQEPRSRHAPNELSTFKTVGTSLSTSMGGELI